MLAGAELQEKKEALCIKSSRSCTLGRQECRDRVFALRGDADELQGWAAALGDVLENEGGQTASPEVVRAPPFKAFDVASGQAAAQTGLSLSGQRSIQENEFYKNLNLDKICRLLFLDDVLLAIDWIGLDGVENIGFVVYNQVLGQLADALGRCDKSVRESISSQWEKPLLRLNVIKEDSPAADAKEGEKVDMVDGELVVAFKVSNVRQIGGNLMERFGGKK